MDDEETISCDACGDDCPGTSECYNCFATLCENCAAEYDACCANCYYDVFEAEAEDDE